MHVPEDKAVQELCEFIREEADLDDLAAMVSLFLSDNTVVVHKEDKSGQSDKWRDGRSLKSAANYFCVRTRTAEGTFAVRERIQLFDSKAIFDQEANPVTFWVHTVLPLDLIVGMPEVEDVIEST